MRNFDRFVGIDWTGAKSPVFTKAISVAVCEQDIVAPRPVQGPWSRAKIAAWVKVLAGENKRTLIGIDCNFGYAEGIGRAQFGDNYDYRDLWRAVDDAAAAQDNYFAGGYWQLYPAHFWSEGKKPAHIILSKRLTEIVCGESGYGWPESPFKLLGPKQVGKGGLAGMRMALDLKQRCGDDIAVWPFERDLSATARVVMTEIFPRQFLRRVGHGNAKLRHVDELNRALAALGSAAIPDMTGFTDHDGDALVSAAGLRFLCGRDKNVPTSIATPPMMTDNHAKREGWIFGVGDK